MMAMPAIMMFSMDVTIIGPPGGGKHKELVRRKHLSGPTGDTKPGDCRPWRNPPTTKRTRCYPPIAPIRLRLGEIGAIGGLAVVRRKKERREENRVPAQRTMASVGRLLGSHARKWMT